MITARPQKNLRVARSYFREHLAAGDYHSEGQTIQGEWCGLGIRRLGLDPAGAVTEEAYLRLCENRHPITGEKLTVRQRTRERRVFYDFVASAPKSVSIMALLAGDRRLVSAHDEAARAAIAVLERSAAVRVRKKGQQSDRGTGEIVAAIFRHETSRALDPQLHSHFVVFNATWDPIENRWKALQPGAMFEHINLSTEIYRSELAVRVQKLGYQIVNTSTGFEIAGVAPELIARFSKRRQAIVQQEVRMRGAKSSPLTNNQRASLARLTRQRKLKRISASEVLEQQRSQLRPEELADLLAQIPAPPPKSSLATARTGRGISAAEAIDFASAHLFERRSVVRPWELLEEALRFSRGSLTFPEVEAELALRKEFIAADGELTTRECLSRERRMISLAQQGIGRCRPLNAAFQGNERLSPEQRLALQSLLRSPDRVIALRGGAGTGKTFLLKDVVAGISQRDVGVYCFAPKATAVDALKREGFPQPRTVQHLLVNESLQKEAGGQVILVEEAGLLSVKEMLALLELTQADGGRLILSGDTRQHTSIEAGDALRILETQRALQPVELRSIRRQIQTEYRQAVTEIAKGNPLGGLLRLERIGAVRAVEDETRYDELAAEYVVSMQEGKTALIVCPTWREIEVVDGSVRPRLKAEGLLGQDEITVTVHQSLKWTKAEKRDLKAYRPGHILIFHKATADFSAGDCAKVVAANQKRILLKKPSGEEVEVTGKQSGCFDVFKPTPLLVAPGEKILLQGNRKKDRLLNGQLATVKSVAKDGEILLDDGRRVPPEFRQFTHGYCVTSQAAQGKTVDHVYVAVDSHTLVAANRNQFYVSVSRGREKVKIFTDDDEFLRQAVEKSGNRPSAMEMIQAVAQRRRGESQKPEHHAHRAVKI